MNCHKCGDKVDMNAGHVCLTGNDRLKERITYLQARIAELEHKLANYQAAADGDTHWCAECKMKDERIAELEKRATRLAQEYCELAEVWQKHECNPAPPEEVSNET